MAADFSRVRANPLLDYAGVELKQGGVVLDADANELVAILDRRLRALASDTLGRARVSSTTPHAFKVTDVGGTLAIARGRLYVDGLLAENHGVASAIPAKREFDDLMAEPSFTDPIGYAAQPYLPSAPVLPNGGRHLVYLDVWNREVTHLEQPALVERAVGVETSSRRQTVWQARVLADRLGAGVSCKSPDADFAGWSDLIAPSTGVLTTGTFDVAPADDPCELPPSGGYRGLENQLYRVEIHHPGQPGGSATFKWSRENASVGSRVASIVSKHELELETLGLDDVLRFNDGDWVEITDDWSELTRDPAAPRGEMRQITIDERTRRISFTGDLPDKMLPPAPAIFPDSAFPKTTNLRVRRWDQKGRVFRTNPGGNPVQVQNLDAAGSKGAINVPAAGVRLLLESGVTVSFDSTGTKGFNAGDYWVFAARTADASVEKLNREPPRGIHHHYTRLGIWDVDAGTVSDCRHPWPPTCESCDCACTACVKPETHASGKFTIQDAVDRVRKTGGTICLHAGQYTLDEPVRIARTASLRVFGQGPATVLVAPGSAFVIEQGAAIAVEDLAIISLGQQPAVRVRTALGLALRRLTIVLAGRDDLRAAGIALAGVVAAVSIAENLIVAPDGVRAAEKEDDRQPFLITAALHVENNILVCGNRGVTLAGPVAHLHDTRICDNDVLGCRELGVGALGVAFLGASARFERNNLNVDGSGVVSAIDGTWIEANKLNQRRPGQRLPSEVGIALTTGLDPNGSDQCQILANQVIGFRRAGIVVAAPSRELIVKLNIIERCGNGILMDDAAETGSLSIENNHLRDIGPAPGQGGQGLPTIGIGVTRTESATVAGNILRRVGTEAAANQQLLIAGVLSAGVERLRVHGNEISELGPLADIGGPVAGIIVSPPYTMAEISHNRVERETQASGQPSGTPWIALRISEPAPREHLVFTLADHVLLPIDDVRSLVFMGKRAHVYSAKAEVDLFGAAVARGGSASVLGNVFIARGSQPAIDVIARAELLFSDNRCELRGNRQDPAVQLRTAVAIVNANRVRNGGPISIRVDRPALVAAMGNITTGRIDATLRPAMVPLNLRG
jgi:hypothetical protein